MRMRKHLLLLIFSLALPTGLLAGNTWQTATAIAEGETLSGTMDKNDTEEWYKIVIPKDGDVTLNVKTDATLVMRYVELHAKSSDIYLGSWGWKYLYEKEEPFTVCGLAPGTYYVHLSREEKAGSYTFSYTFTPENYANDTEPNNEWKQASTTLVSGETIQGHLGYNYWDSTDKDDWYKIVVPADGDVTFDVKTDETLVIRYVELHAKSSDIYLGSWGFKYLYEAEAPFTVSGVAPGTYYVHLNHESGYGGYSLKYTFTRNYYPNDAGPNDDWKQAVTLKKDKTVSGHLGYNYWDNIDQTDWYKINLKQSGSIELHLTTDKASPLLVRYVELYKVSGDYVSSLKYEYQYEEFKPVIVNDLVPGTYYVKVEREDKYGTYFLVWGSTLKLVGDVNNDGKVTAADARAVADYIMGKTPAGFNIMMADVNEDGKINVVDVTSIIGIINKK